jgi:hypothetical protein
MYLDQSESSGRDRFAFDGFVLVMFHHKSIEK